MKFLTPHFTEFPEWQRKQLEALFIVLNWTQDYLRRYPNDPVGKEWFKAIESAIMIVYEEALFALRNRSVAFHSGLDTTEAPPEILRLVNEELASRNCGSIADSFIESSNNVHFGNASTSVETIETIEVPSRETINVLYFGPDSRFGSKTNTGSSSNQSFVSASENSSSEDGPFGFKFPHKMCFNLRDYKPESIMNLTPSKSSLSFQSNLLDVSSSEKIQIQPTESSLLDRTSSFASSIEYDKPNPALEFIRTTAGFKLSKKQTYVAEGRCTSPFCLCGTMRAANEEYSEDSLDNCGDTADEHDAVEPYLEVENFSNLELSNPLDDTSESLILLQPFNTPNDTAELETSGDSIFLEDIPNTSFSLPGTPFNTAITPIYSADSLSSDMSLNDSLGVADLGGDENITTILARKSSVDTDYEYIRRERERILASYEKNKLQDGKDSKSSDKSTFATSTPNWRSSGSSDDKHRRKDC